MIGVKSIKKWLGIEGVSVDLDVPEAISYSKNPNIKGKVLLSTLRDSDINEIEVKLIEKYQRGRGKSKLIDEYTLGTVVMKEDIQLMKDEQRSIDFNLPVKLNHSTMDKWGNKNFLFKGISSLAKMGKGVKSWYRIEVIVKVSGTKLNPHATREIVIND